MAGLKFQSKVLKRQRFAEVGVLDEAFDAALPAQSGLIGEQAMQELQVRPAVLLGVGQGRVELVGGHRDAQGGEVGEDLVTQAWVASVSSDSSVGFFFGRGFIGGFLGQE